jgi:ElaB/YqjD/DUF883 family membrane-anchored ribosome-binding protein
MTSDFPAEAERPSGTRLSGDDAAFARLEKEMANMRDAVGGLSDCISGSAVDAGSGAQEQAERGVQHVRSNVGSMLNDASDRLGVVTNRAQSQSSSFGDLLEGAIRERPLGTLALAIGLGFFAGVIWRR